MKENKNESFDAEQFKGLDGAYHFENKELSENELKSLLKFLTSDDKVVVQGFGDTNLETNVDKTTLDN